MSNLLAELLDADTFVSRYNPVRPLAGDTKGASYRTSTAEALTKRYIQNHPNRARKLLVLDFDSIDGEPMDVTIKSLAFDLELIPVPSYICSNPLTGGAHAAYWVEGTTGSEKGLEYWDDTFTGLKDASGSDFNYTGQKTYNPLHPSFFTEFLTAHEYSLKELKEFTTAKPKSWYRKKNKLNVNGSRTLELFDKLSEWGYHEWRKDSFEVRIMLEAQRLNTEFATPLPQSQLNATVKSIENFIKVNFASARGRKEFSATQSYRANLRWDGQGERTNEELVAMVDAGFTKKEIAAATGKSMGATYQAVGRALVAAGRK